MIRRLLVAVPLLAACEATTPVAVTVQARGATAVWVDVGGGWVEVPIDADVARFDVDTPYALAVRCDDPAPRARIVLAGPADADRWFLDCPGRPVPFVGTTFRLPMDHFADLALGQEWTEFGGETLVEHAPGEHDVVLADVFGTTDDARAMILHDLALPGGTTVDVDLDRDGVALEERERIVRGTRGFDVRREGSGVTTARGTSMELPGDFPSASLGDDDAAWAYLIQGPTGGPHGFAMVDTAATDGALTLDLRAHSENASITTDDGVVVRWSTDVAWNRAQVRSGESWGLDAYPGWVTTHADGELAAPEPPDPWEGWRGYGSRPRLLLAIDDDLGMHGEIYADDVSGLDPGPSGRP